MSFCPSDSPVGPKHGDAGGQDPRWSQQVDHRPELGAPSHVSETFSGESDKSVTAWPSVATPPAAWRRLFILDLSVAWLCSQKADKKLSSASESGMRHTMGSHGQIRPEVTILP